MVVCPKNRIGLLSGLEAPLQDYSKQHDRPLKGYVSTVDAVYIQPNELQASFTV